MKKLLICILIICICFSLNSCKVEEALNPEAYIRNMYSINVDYDSQNRTIKGNETLLYINSNCTEDLYFHLYPNVYKDEKTAPEFISIPNSYPNAFNEGYININEVKINGAKVTYKVDESLLRVEIPVAIRQNDTMKVQISFNSLLPDAKTRYGKYEGLTHCAYWYPILAAYDENGWDKVPFNPIGESSFSEVADYLVKITLPRNEVVCATGEKLGEKNVFSNKKTVTYSERNIRDFTWFSSENFKLVEKEIGGITYRYYYEDEKTDNPKEVLDQSMLIFDFYNNKFGNYPYKQFNIVKTQLSTCEFPEAITITKANLGNSNLLRLALAHEVAHQWWYLAVGNSQFKEPWLDEALASYSMHLYNNSLFGDIGTRIDIIERYPDKLYEIPINSPVVQFESMTDYGDIVYNWGCIALYELHNKIGETAFYKVLSSYYKDNIFKNAKTADFLKTIGGISDKETVEWFRNLLTIEENAAVSKEQKESMQIQIMKTEQEKLKSGEMIAFHMMKYGEKVLYQPIEAHSYTEIQQYEKLMPILTLQTVGKFDLNYINIEPDYKALDKWAKDGYSKKDYSIKDIQDLGACGYTYGSYTSGEFAIITISPTSNNNELNMRYDFLTTNGKKLTEDSDIFYYSTDKSASAGYSLKYLGNEFEIIITMYTKDKSIDIIDIAEGVYNVLGK